MALFARSYDLSLKFPNGGGFGASGVFDFNGDGYDDLIFGLLKWPPSHDLLPVIVARNNGNGTFTDVSEHIVGGIPGVIHPREIITGDFNGDGFEDVFIADHGYDADPFPGIPNRLLVSENGGLHFSEARLPGLADFTHSTSTADVDGDGDLDIIVGNMFGQNMYGPYILINDGSGNFSISGDSLPSSVASIENGHYSHQEFGDINGDGAPDLFLGSGSGYHRILMNDGSGKFIDNNLILPAAFAGQSQAIDVDFLDLNGDGLTDILVSSYRYDFTGVGTQLFVQQQDGAFIDEAAQRFGVGDADVSYWRPWNYLADFDGDGDIDILSTYGGDGAPKPDLWINEGGNFTRARLDFLTSEIAFIGDFDGNGTPDIGSVAWDGLVTIFLNQTPPDLRQEGSAGNDIITVRPGARVIDGLGGIDTVEVGMDRSAYSTILINDGSIRLSDPSGGSYTLISIERLKFSDGILLFDIDSINAPAAYRLYGGAFDRTPDEDGLLFWVDYLNNGGTLHEAASGFIASPEFIALYGAGLSDAEFIDQLYLNVLGRSGEAAGIDYWNSYLAESGDHAGALVNFTQLEEYVGLSLANIENGYWVV